MLLQVYLHAAIAAETGAFDIEDVAAGLREKMIRRNPHVFGDVRETDPARINETWEAVKAAEKQRDGLFDGHPARAARADPGGQGARPARACRHAPCPHPTPPTWATGCWRWSPRRERRGRTRSRRCVTPYDGPEREPTDGRTAPRRCWSCLPAGCAAGTDDELAPPPTKTVTATPSQSVAPAPATVPVGQGDVSPSDVVWAQRGVLHVGGDQVDLAPVDIDAFVVVRGGVFVLAEGELWFTDLARLRGTGQTEVTGVQVNGDASLLNVVDTRRRSPRRRRATTPARARPSAARSDTLTPEQKRRGPGRFVVTTSAAGVPSVVEAATGDRVQLEGAPAHFRLGGWAGDSVFFGVGTAATGAVPPHRPVRRRGRDVPPARSGRVPARSSSVPAGRRVLRGIAACPG